MNTQIEGYYRFPTIHGDKVVFVAEDDLWEVPVTGGVARRLTANLGTVSRPFFSPDGRWLAFVGREEGHAEVYVMPASGGPARRLTFLGSNAAVVGWHEDRIVFASDVGRPFRRDIWLHSVDLYSHLKRRRTYPGFFPVLHLDHIYFSGNVEIRRVELPRTRLALVASDHLPLVADLRLRF